MTKLTPIQIDDNTIIYIEATDDADGPVVSPIEDIETEEEEEEERGRVSRGIGDRVQKNVQKKALQSFQAIESTIRLYTAYTLNAFKEMAVANIDKVTLEFGITVGGDAGIPYITKGKTESNLKITVECSFPKEDGKPTGK